MSIPKMQPIIVKISVKIVPPNYLFPHNLLALTMAGRVRIAQMNHFKRICMISCKFFAKWIFR